jgi:hypothetical protein
MTQAAFEEQYGPIALDENQNQFFSKFKHPHFVDGKWRKRSANITDAIPLLKGQFYNIGFFPEGQYPTETEHDWEALAYAIEFTTDLAITLEDSACFAGLSTEGDLFWFPLIVYPPSTNEDSFNLEEYVISQQPEALKDAYESGAISKNYHRTIRTWSLEFQNNIFWRDDRDDDMKAGLEESAYAGYTAVSKKMKTHLTDIRISQCYTDYQEFPVLFYGKDRYGNYLGLITSVVWT